jgi:hypothetical protein
MAGRRHPAARAAAIVIVIVGLGLAHPFTDGPLAGIAQLGLYIAILGPLFWVPRLALDMATFRRLALLLWGINAASAALGALQVYAPGSFQPNLSSVIAEQADATIDGLQIVTATGERVFRPMGLTDVPGGASIAGFYTLLFGVGIYLTKPAAWLRVLTAASMLLGLTCIYLSQIRSILVLALTCLLVLGGLLLWHRRLRELASLSVVTTVVVLGGLAVAVSLGGDSVTERLLTLIEDAPVHVYYQNRGFFLEYTMMELLPEHPLGAGLGRWGMSNAYFGDSILRNGGPIWVEIQWTGWVVDGGVPLMAAYVLVLALAFVTAVGLMRRGAVDGRTDVVLWAGIVAGYNVGMFALTFNYALFISQIGMDFWLINAALFAASRPARSSA